MKKIFYCFAVLFFIPGTAFALAVGDYALYDFRFGFTDHGTYEYLIVKQTGDREYLVRTTTTKSGQAPEVREKIWRVEQSGLYDEELINQTLTRCRELGGINEPVSVPAGKFNTCRLKHEGWGTISITNIGAVSFGTIKGVAWAGPFALTISLRLFKPGHP